MASSARGRAPASRTEPSSSTPALSAGVKSDQTIRPLSMDFNVDEFDIWKLRFQMYIQREKPELVLLLQASADEVDAADSQKFAALLLPFLADSVVTRFRRTVLPASGGSPNGVQLYRMVCDSFQRTAPQEELPEEMFARSLRSCFRDKFPSVPEFVRAVQDDLQSVETAAAASMPAMERVYVLHILTQLSIGTLCPWASGILHEYRTVYRTNPSLDRVPKGHTLADVVHTVMGHLTVAPGARDTLSARRVLNRDWCGRCRRYGHVEGKCTFRAGGNAPPQWKGAATGPRVNSVMAADGTVSYCDDYGNPIQSVDC